MAAPTQESSIVCPCFKMATSTRENLWSRPVKVNNSGKVVILKHEGAEGPDNSGVVDGLFRELNL